MLCRLNHVAAAQYITSCTYSGWWTVSSLCFGPVGNYVPWQNKHTPKRFHFINGPNASFQTIHDALRWRRHCRDDSGQSCNMWTLIKTNGRFSLQNRTDCINQQRNSKRRSVEWSGTTRLGFKCRYWRLRQEMRLQNVPRKTTLMINLIARFPLYLIDHFTY